MLHRTGNRRKHTARNLKVDTPLKDTGAAAADAMSLIDTEKPKVNTWNIFVGHSQ